MSLDHLGVSRVRNLKETSLGLKPGFNLFVGPNGSGKTSLLESAYFLSSGRSFRDVSADPLMTRGEDNCLVTGTLSLRGVRYSVGVERTRDGTRQIRINGEKVLRASELAHLLPVLVLGPDSVDLLLGPPGLRRRFLNWGLFHVEPSFPATWEEANRCLRQRNLLLRDSSSASTYQTLGAWTEQLVGQAEKIDQMRERFIGRYEPVFRDIAGQLADLEGLSIQYYRGWDRSASLADIYTHDAELDKKRGYTQKGFQRADVRITVDGQPASKVCSRGELKALVWSMILAQGALMKGSAEAGQQRDTLYLVDDLASELDGEHRRRVCRFLADTGQQVVLTGVDQDALVEACEGKYDQMFHVKHGQVEMTSSQE